MFILLLSDRPENLYRAEDFSTFTSSGDVLLDVCAAPSPAQLMRDRSAEKVCPTCLRSPSPSSMQLLFEHSGTHTLMHFPHNLTSSSPNAISAKQDVLCIAEKSMSHLLK